MRLRAPAVMVTGAFFLRLRAPVAMARGSIIWYSHVITVMAEGESNIKTFATTVMAVGRSNRNPRVTVAMAPGKLGDDMTIKSKKNLVWLCIFVVVAGWTVYYVHNRSVQQSRQEMIAKINTIREDRRMFNATIMREAGISANIADGADCLPSDDIAYFCDFIREQCGRTVQVSDVAMWLEEPQIKLLLTADTLYLCNPQVGAVQYWDLNQMDVSEVEWQRKTHGDIFIYGKSYHFLEDSRKPFTDAIRKIIVNSKVHTEDNALSERLRELE